MKRALLLLSVLGALACGPDGEDLEIGVTIRGLPDISANYLQIRDRQHLRSFDVTSTNSLFPRTVYHGGDNQQFMMVPVSRGSNDFYLVPKHLGGVLTVSPLTNTIVMSNAYPSGSNRQRFFLGPDMGFENFNIRTSHATRNFDAPSSGAIYAGSPHSGQNQQFNFRVAEPFPHATPAEVLGADPGMIGDVPRLTSHGSVPPETSTPVLIGEGPLAFIYVEGDNNRAFQVQETPYYKLTREQFWTLAAFGEKPASFEITQSYTVTHGMSETNSRSVEATLGFIVKASGELAFPIEELKATLGFSLEEQLKVMTTLETSITYTQEETESMSFTVEAGKRVSWAAWHLTDRYTLRRGDGSVYKTWKLVYRNIKIIDDYSE